MRQNWQSRPGAGAPAFDCLTDGHLWLDWHGTGRFILRQKIDPVPVEPTRASWCLWCGTGVHDTDLDCEGTQT